MGPGEYIGLGIQRWLVNGQEPHDPHERGARMGQFLSMLHAFMALQTGTNYHIKMASKINVSNK